MSDQQQQQQKQQQQDDGNGGDNDAGDNDIFYSTRDINLLDLDEQQPMNNSNNEEIQQQKTTTTIIRGQDDPPSMKQREQQEEESNNSIQIYQPDRVFMTYKRQPEDPTRPPTTRHLMEQAKLASEIALLQEQQKEKKKKPQRDPSASELKPAATPPVAVVSYDDDDDEESQSDKKKKKKKEGGGKKVVTMNNVVVVHGDDDDDDGDDEIDENETHLSSGNAIAGTREGSSDDIPGEIGGKDTFFMGGDTTTDTSTEFSYLSPIPARANVVDLETMKDSVWYTYPDWQRRLSGFTLLIILASIIATCGILNDSTATVIGAMIVAPLMTPILGAMLGIVLTDIPNMVVSFTLVLLGMACAVSIGFLFSLFVDESSIEPQNNSQVSSRIQPKLLDLIAALATGAVAAVALVRTDIAGSLPGVSIAISLVPPLNVIGVCLRLKFWNGAIGAFLLFLTNYLCILAVGIAVMMMYRVHRMVRRRKYAISRFGLWLTQKISIITVIVLLAGTGGFLYYSSSKSRKGNEIEACLSDSDIYPIIDWTQGYGEYGNWTVISVKATHLAAFNTEWKANVIFAGKPPFPIFGNMKTVAELCDVDDISLQFVPTYLYTDLLTTTDSPSSQPSSSLMPSVSTIPSEMPSEEPSSEPSTSAEPSNSAEPSMMPTPFDCDMVNPDLDTVTIASCDTTIDDDDMIVILTGGLNCNNEGFLHIHGDNVTLCGNGNTVSNNNVGNGMDGIRIRGNNVTIYDITLTTFDHGLKVQRMATNAQLFNVQANLNGFGITVGDLGGETAIIVDSTFNANVNKGVRALTGTTVTFRDSRACGNDKDLDVNGSGQINQEGTTACNTGNAGPCATTCLG